MKQLNDQYFTYRQTPVDYDGVARPSIKGNTLVWNQLVQNGNFASSSGWSGGSNTTISVSNNVLTATPTDSSLTGNRFVRRNETYSLPAGHKLFISFRATSTSGSVNIQYVKTSPWTVVYNKAITLSTSSFTQVTDVFELTNEVNMILFNFDGKNDLQLSNVWMADLTQAYGSGNEPTIEQFTSLFPLNYYAYGQYLLNFNGTGIKTTGKNLLNCQWTGTFSSSGLTWTFNNDGSVTINGTSTSAGIMCWNYQYSGATSAGTQNNGRKYIPNGEYILSGGISNKLNVQIRVSTVPSGGDTGFISASGSEVHVTIDDTYPYNWVRLMYEANKTFNNETCYPMIRYDTAEGGFEPYHTETTSLPISTYFPTGMKSAGSVYDELTESKAITRVGSVDLGTMSWTAVYQNGIYRMRSYDIKTLIKYPSANNQLFNGICSKYEIKTANNTYDGVVGISSQNNGDIYVYDSNYTDATAFTNAMSGVYLNYELATYTEQDAEDIFYDFYGNGTEQLLPVNTDTPSTSPLLADIIYYNLTDSEVPYRVFWAINSKGERWDFTEREFKSFMNNPQGLGFSKTISVNRYGNVQNLTDITDNFPQPNGEILFYDSSNSTRYDKYNQFVKFLSYEPITLYYKIPVSFYSRIPNTYSLECVVGTLTKTESKTDNMMNCSITYNALSFYKGEEVEISGTGLTYTINNDGDFPVGFEIEINATYNYYMQNPYIQLSQDGSLYGEAKFIDATRFNKVYINSKDGEQNVILQQSGSVLPNPMSYQDLSISNGSIYVTFVKLARGETTLTIGADSQNITDVTIKYTPIYRSV